MYKLTCITLSFQRAIPTICTQHSGTLLRSLLGNISDRFGKFADDKQIHHDISIIFHVFMTMAFTSVI